MGVKKYRSIEQMPGPPPRPPLEADNLRQAFELMALARALRPFGLTPGVRKFRSLDERHDASAAAPPAP